MAILGRGAAPIVTRTELPGDPADAQSRYIEAAVSGVLVASFYAPGPANMISNALPEGEPSD